MNYGPNELKMAGAALFGDRWQTDLSRALGLSDARRIRQRMTGDRPIPFGIWDDIKTLLNNRQLTIKKVLKALKTNRV